MKTIVFLLLAPLALIAGLLVAAAFVAFLFWVVSLEPVREKIDEVSRKILYPEDEAEEAS